VSATLVYSTDKSVMKQEFCGNRESEEERNEIEDVRKETVKERCKMKATCTGKRRFKGWHPDVVLRYESDLRRLVRIIFQNNPVRFDQIYKQYYNEDYCGKGLKEKNLHKLLKVVKKSSEGYISYSYNLQAWSLPRNTNISLEDLESLVVSKKVTVRLTKDEGKKVGEGYVFEQKGIRGLQLNNIVGGYSVALSIEDGVISITVKELVRGGGKIS